MNKVKSCITVLALIFSIGASAQNEQPLMTIDGKPVFRSEFETIFKKNNKETKITREALDEYIDLFVKFKLKVSEAERLGLDTVGSFITELDGYRKQLAKPYLTDNQLTDELIREAYDRMQWEVRASHVLVKINNPGGPEDTLAAFKKAQEIRRRILAGEKFERVAISASDDPSAKDNFGDLGYFTGLTMVYPFETAAFATPIGQVSEPIRSGFGYHIIKVTDKRKARGERKVAHILLQTDQSGNPQKNITAEAKIKEIHEMLKQGGDFADLAKKYSEDKTTAENGGVLPLFGTGKMVENFEEIAFGLKEIGAISEPFKTDYGWHIIKLLEIKPVGSFEELKPLLVRRISRDDRSKMTRQSFVVKLKKEYNFVEYPANLKPFYKWVDTTVFSGKWNVPQLKSPKKLFEFGGESFNQAQFADFINSKQRKAPHEDITYFVNVLYNQFVEKSIMEYEEKNLEKKHADFRALLKEYRDGILLFDLTNKMVWNKAVEDTSGLRSFYEEHKTDYMWKKRADAVIYKAKDAKLAESAKKLIKKGKSRDEILKEINNTSQLNLVIENVVAETGTNSTLDKFEWKPGISEVKVIEGQHVFVDIKYVMEAQPKKLEEARGAVTAAYQNYLEEKWIKELKDRFRVSVDKNVLYSVQ